MQAKNNKTKSNLKNQLFRIIINKTFEPWGNGENLPQAHLSKKADSPRKFWGEFSNLVGILLWIILGLNLIIIFLIYKIIF